MPSDANSPCTIVPQQMPNIVENPVERFPAMVLRITKIVSLPGVRVRIRAAIENAKTDWSNISLLHGYNGHKFFNDNKKPNPRPLPHGGRGEMGSFCHFFNFD